MNTTKLNLTLCFAIVALLFSSPALQARSHYSKPRDIDRAIHITDIVLRALFPTQTIVVEQQPAVTYTTPFYQSSTTTIITTPTTVITPVYSRPVYVAPTYHYVSPPRYDYYRPAPRWNPPPKQQYRQPQRAPNRPPQGQPPSRRPHGQQQRRR